MERNAHEKKEHFFATLNTPAGNWSASRSHHGVAVVRENVQAGSCCADIVM
jgi:hypothetical protein